MKKGYGRKIAWLLCAVMFINQLSTVAAEETVKQQTVTRFNDIKGHWAEEILTKWEQNGWIEGLPDGSFSPDKVITRAEFVTLMNRLFTPAGMYEGEDKFSDVKEEDWFYKDVMVAMARGYVSGFEDESFKPNAKIVRQDAAVMISKCLNLEESSNEKVSSFKDRDMISTYAKKYVEQLSELKIITGDEQGRFNPKKETTRAEAVVLLDRAYAYYESLVASGVINEKEEKEKTLEEQQGQNSENKKSKEDVNTTTDEKGQAEGNGKHEKDDNSENGNGGSSNLDVPISEKEIEDLVASEVDELDTIYIGFGFSDDEQCVTQDLTLPNRTEKGTSINWSSNNTSMISNSGKVTRPSGTSANVTLTATLTTKEGTRSKQFPLKVIRKSNGEIPHDNSYEEIVELNGEIPEMYVLSEDKVPKCIYGKLTDYRVETPKEAITALESIKTIMKMNNPAEEFIWRTTQTSQEGQMRYYRLQQYYQGYEVKWKQLVIGVKNGEVISLCGHYKPFEKISEQIDLNKGTISENDAKQIVWGKYGNQIQCTMPVRVICCDKNDTPILCWQVGVYGFINKKDLLDVNMYISAECGDIIYTTTNSRNIVRGISNQTKKDGKDILYYYPSVPDGKGEYTLQTNNIILSNQDYGKIHEAPGNIGRATSNVKDGWSDEQILAFCNVKKVYDQYWYPYHWIGIDNNPKSEIFVSTYIDTEQSTNALFRPLQPGTIGQNEEKKRYALLFHKESEEVQWYNTMQNSLDLVAHEYAHGVISARGDFQELKLNELYDGWGKEMGLKEPTNMTLTIDEGFADILGELMEQKIYAIDQPTWTIGEESYINSGSDFEYMRSLKFPTTSKAKYRGVLDVKYVSTDMDCHTAGLIFGHAAYLIWNKGGNIWKNNEWGESKNEYFYLWFDAIANLSEEDSFTDVANNVVLTAYQRGLDKKKINYIIKGFKEVGIFVTVGDLSRKYWYGKYVDIARSKGIIDDTKNITLNVSETEFGTMINKAYKSKKLFSSLKDITVGEASEYVLNALLTSDPYDHSIDQELVRNIRSEVLRMNQRKKNINAYEILCKASNSGGMKIIYGQNDKLLDAKSFVDQGTACAIIVRTLTQ